MAIRMKAGKEIGSAMKILDEAVCITAFCAHNFDFPIGSLVSGSWSSMPRSSSTYLMK